MADSHVQAAKVAEDLGGAELYIEPGCGAVTRNSPTNRPAHSNSESLKTRFAHTTPKASVARLILAVFLFTCIGHAFNRKLKPLTQLCRRKVATFLYGAAVPDRPAKRGMASVATAAAAVGGVAVVAVALHYFQH